MKEAIFSVKAENMGNFYLENWQNESPLHCLERLIEEVIAELRLKFEEW